MFGELNQARASVALLASQIIDQLQPLTVVNTELGQMASGQDRLAAVMRRDGFALKPAARAAAPAPVKIKKRRKRVEITPAMRQVVLNMSKNPENSAKIIANEVGISEPSVFNIRRDAKKAKKAKAKKKTKVASAAAPASAK